MKVAIVHELLTMKGGAERVARVIADMFPDAPVYTLLYDERKLGDWFPRERVRTSEVQPRSSQLAARSFNHHLYLRRFPHAVEAWDFSNYDLVISSSSAFAHGIITNGKPKHLCYVHSPARYLWDRTHDVIGQAGKGLLGSLRRKYLSRTFHKLRIWDSEAADRPDALIAASKEVQRRIELYWRRESDVIYPPIDNSWFADEKARSSQLAARSYFLVVSTLARYKRIDLAIEAANALKAPLKIAGSGADERRLKKLAGSTVTFLGHQSIGELKKLYADAAALIVPGEEDFGLTPLESMAMGTPVIAYKKGGILETVTKETGAYFDEPAAQSLVDVMKTFTKKTFDSETMRSHARKFSRDTFVENLKRRISALMGSEISQLADHSS